MVITGHGHERMPCRQVAARKMPQKRRDACRADRRHSANDTMPYYALPCRDLFTVVAMRRARCRFAHSPLGFCRQSKACSALFSIRSFDYRHQSPCLTASCRTSTDELMIKSQARRVTDARLEDCQGDKGMPARAVAGKWLRRAR